MNIVIYGRDGCVYCDKAVHLSQSLVQESQHSYTYKKLGIDYSVEEFSSRFPRARTVPQIYVDEKHVGGYTDLVKFLEANNPPI